MNKTSSPLSSLRVTNTHQNLQIHPHFDVPSAYATRNIELINTGGSTLPVGNFHAGVTNLPRNPGEDTLVFIKPAHLGAINPVDCGGNAITPCVMTVSSKRLMATKSPVFSDQFEPRFQQRLMRRYGLKTLPEDIDWLLDLTPPEDGDEIGPQMILLSLTPGLVKWSHVAAKMGVTPSLIMGHDDACHCDLINYYSDPTGSSVGPISTSQYTSKEGKYNSYGESSWDEYSQTRHFRALVRLMRVAKGQDLVIDSAPRLWTMVGLADILQCTNLIQDDVLRWLAEDRNRNFIAYLPEESLVIGHKMKLPDITRSAFTILVNEMAFDLLAPETTNNGNEDEDQVNAPRIPTPGADVPEYTVFGRKRNMDVLDDDLKSMLQEAARRWADKVREAVDNVCRSGPSEGRHDIFSIFRILEWEVLSNDYKLIDKLLERASPGAPSRENMMLMHDQIVKSLRRKWKEYIENGVDRKMTALQYKVLQDSYCDLGGKRFDLSSAPSREFSTGQKFLIIPTWDRLQGLGWGQTAIGPLLRSAHSITQGRLLCDVCAEFQKLMDTIDSSVPHFDLNRFSMQLERTTDTMCAGWKEVENDMLRGLDLSTQLVLNLDPGVFSMLPTYADGNDDETGGVYGMHVPDAVMGPIGPGPAYRTGYTQFSDATSFAPSEATCTETETMGRITEEGTTTANASRDATNQPSLPDAEAVRLRVYSPGSITSAGTMSSLGKRMGEFDLVSIPEGSSVSGLRGQSSSRASDLGVKNLGNGDTRSSTMGDSLAAENMNTDFETEFAAYTASVGGGIEGVVGTAQALDPPSSRSAVHNIPSEDGTVEQDTSMGADDGGVDSHDNSADSGNDFDLAEEVDEDYDFGYDEDEDEHKGKKWDSDVEMDGGDDSEESWDVLIESDAKREGSD
ncbi:hypothetical protein MKZ38_003598 [Zalerion maritima]|uniref:Uncharacterized protein n=1 Tax=Zalerion maritima TaxID=339359 RepID=A0AAD5RML9_9PEZI|nr:hypothetical protein MKZ38_003598 [Zalerion maritima]